MESTGVYWMSPFKYLERAGLTVYIVNPRSVKGMVGKKTDTSDAEWLATKGNDGSFKPSYIPAEPWRQLRDVSRNLIVLKQETTRLKNRETKMFLAMGYRIDSVFSDPFGLNAQRAKDAILAGKTPIQVLQSINTRMLKASQEDLLEAFNGDLDEKRVSVIESNRKVLNSITTEVDETRDKLIADVEQREPMLFDLFQTVPGIDQYHSATLLVEFGGSAFIEAFSTFEKFASWLGVNPGNKESGGKRHPCRSRHGNWAARRCLCEAAHAASHVKGSTIQSRYRALRARIGTKKAIMATAHHIAKLLYVVASRQQPYEDPNVDYEGKAFDKAFQRYVKQAIKCKERWNVNVKNLETGEVFQSPKTPSNADNVTPTAPSEPVVPAAPESAPAVIAEVEATPVSSAPAVIAEVEATPVSSAPAVIAEVEATPVSSEPAVIAEVEATPVSSAPAVIAEVEATPVSALAALTVEQQAESTSSGTIVTPHSDVNPKETQNQYELSLLRFMMLGFIVVFLFQTTITQTYTNLDEQPQQENAIEQPNATTQSLHIKNLPTQDVVKQYSAFKVPQLSISLNVQRVRINTIRGAPTINI